MEIETIESQSVCLQTLESYNKIVENYLITDNIFKFLDDQNLAKCQLISKSWKTSLDREKWFHLKVIKKLLSRPPNDSWNEIFEKVNLTKNLIKIRNALQDFKRLVYEKDFLVANPLHVAASTSDSSLFQLIYKLDATQIEQGIFCPLHNYYLKEKLNQHFYIKNSTVCRGRFKKNPTQVLRLPQHER